MGYGKSKPGMFKMKHQGVPALLKALVGDQHKLPDHLKKAIKDAPPKKGPGDKKKKDTFRYESDMGDYSPTITAKKKTRGGPGNQPPVADKEGRVRAAGESFGSRGSRVVKTTGTDKKGKRKAGTRQETVEVSYSSGKKSPVKKTDCPPGWSAEKCAKAKAGVKAKKDAKAAQTAADAGKKQRISKNLDKAYKEGKVTKNGKRYR